MLEQTTWHYHGVYVGFLTPLATINKLSTGTDKSICSQCAAADTPENVKIHAKLTDSKHITGKGI